VKFEFLPHTKFNKKFPIKFPNKKKIPPQNSSKFLQTQKISLPFDVTKHQSQKFVIIKENKNYSY
jgi:hypothetical protein